jgi:hypothetical protein
MGTPNRVTVFLTAFVPLSSSPINFKLVKNHYLPIALNLLTILKIPSLF